jgi:hypothetical protein
MIDMYERRGRVQVEWQGCRTIAESCYESLYDAIRVGENISSAYCNRGYMFYTMRRGLSEGYDGCEGSGYDYRATDQ